MKDKKAPSPVRCILFVCSYIDCTLSITLLFFKTSFFEDITDWDFRPSHCCCYSCCCSHF